MFPKLRPATAWLLAASLFLAIPARAEFLISSLEVHPIFLPEVPVILDIQGVWPTDCHPGEQKPIVEATASTIDITFEIIVEHVTCNDVQTNYRILADLGPAVLDQGVVFEEQVTMTVTFQGEFNQQVLSTYQGSPGDFRYAESSPDFYVPVESGVFSATGLDKQGILFGRQSQVLGAYPLVYDAQGSSEWVLGAGRLRGNTAFLDLNRTSGGQCLNCDEPGNVQASPSGRMSVLVDKAGVLQVKINDGLFREFRAEVYGYLELPVEGGRPRVDLSGVWAFNSKSDESDPLQSAPPATLLPLVFRIESAPDLTATLDNGVYYYRLFDASSEADTEALMVIGCYDSNADILACGATDADKPLQSILSAEIGLWIDSPRQLYLENNNHPITLGFSSGWSTAVRVDSCNNSPYIPIRCNP